MFMPLLFFLHIPENLILDLINGGSLHDLPEV